MERQGNRVPGYALLVCLCVAIGCSPVPRKYIRDAVPNVTLVSLQTTPDLYRNRLVIMGAVLLEEEHRDGALWLHVKNRPLDQDYRPQLPPSVNDPEAGWYWIVVGSQEAFRNARQHWVDMTVVGRVTGLAPGKEPVLNMVYVRGWGRQSDHDGVWEELVDANYIPFVPSEVKGELGQ